MIMDGVLVDAFANSFINCQENGDGELKDYQLKKVERNHPLSSIDDSFKSQLVILVFRSVEKTFVATPKSVNGNDESQVSLEGSPLKLEEFHVPEFGFDTDSKNENIFHLPLTVNESRQILSLYSTAVQRGKLTSPYTPLWVLCDNRHSSNIACLGVSFHTNDKEELVQYTCKVTAKDHVVSKSKLPWLQQTIRRYGKTNANIDCFAEYKIYGSGQRDAHHGSLGVQMKWERATNPLQTPPLDAATTVLAQVIGGDMRSSIYSLYSELITLQGMVKGLTDGVVTWSELGEDNNLPLIDRVYELCKEVKCGYPAKGRDKAETEETDDIDPAKRLYIKQRQYFDFTEQLWNVLKECTSMKDLIESMTHIFNSLKRKEIEPMLNKTNKCRLAEYIRDSYYDRLLVPQIRGSLPLELLVEIGIEKLQRDYIDALIELVTQDSLNYFTDSSLEFSEKLIRLEKLHQVLELIMVLQGYLNVPTNHLAVAARQALKHYESNPVDPCHVFRVSVPMTAIVNRVESIQPTVWKAKVNLKIEGHSLNNVYMLSQKPTLPHIQNCINDDADTVQDYFLTCLTQDALNV